MAKSILQKTSQRECYLCRMEAYEKGLGEIDLPCTGLNKHHFIHGTSGRKQAERYGLWAYLCTARHHIYGPEAPHANGKVNKKLQGIAQQEFEKLYGHEKFMEVFQENFIEESDWIIKTERRNDEQRGTKRNAHSHA